MAYKTIMHEDGTLEKVENGAKLSTPELQPSLSVAELEGMTRDELIALIHAACPDKAQVLLMTEEQRGRAIVDMLAITALTSADRKEARECGKEWLDRTIGKPLQRQMTALAVGVSFTDILAELDGSTADRDGIE